MPKSIEVAGVAGQCPVCHHAPIRHVEDGTGATCIVCLKGQQYVLEGMTAPGIVPGRVCTMKFEFKLSKREREQAVAADKGSYEQHKVCAECYCEWMAHEGYLCPTGDSTFRPLLEEGFLVTHD